MAKKNIAAIRKTYLRGSLLETEVDSQPYVQFVRWFSENLRLNKGEPTAMILSTALKSGKPSSRVVLLKDHSAEEGFVFFTNYESRKGQEIKTNPYASLLFFWPEQERQIRIEGKLTKTSRAISEAYFHSRPRESQIAAWTSEQSQRIPDRAYLEKTFKKMAHYFDGESVIPLPPDWGGYRLAPLYMEFWQGRKDRLHDRIAYVLKAKTWTRKRLAP
jgi:pyridoxamine 5'-phosphate oxidase